MKHSKKISAIGAVAAAAVLLSGCSGGSDDGAGDAGTVTIGTLSWEESLAVTAVWEQILTDEGFEVEVKQLDPGPAYQALSTGQIDVFPEQWPNYFGNFMEKYADDVEPIGTWYEGTDINLAVPDYVDPEIKSIADLAEHADMFGGEIVGIESGSETMKILDSDVMETYGLDDFKV